MTKASIDKKNNNSDVSKHRRKQKFKIALQYEILIVPALVLYILFCGVPFIATFLYSVTDYNIYNLKDYGFAGLSNYIKVFETSVIKTALLNSIWYALAMTFFQSLIAIPLAVLLNNKIPGRNFMRAGWFLPAMFSPMVVGFLFKFLFGRSGPVNMFLQNLGHEGIAFFSTDNALNTIIFSQVWQWTGWAMVIYLANLQTIPSDMIEAARVDGASGFDIFFRITLPLLYPGVTVVGISSLVGGLKVFDIVYSMTNGGPGYSTETIMSTMLKITSGRGDYALASAFGVVFFAVVLFISMILLRLLKVCENKVN